MAIVSVKPLPQRRRSSKKGGKESHALCWRVITDDPFDGTIAAINADGIPNEGDLLENNPALQAVLRTGNANPSFVKALLRGKPLILCSSVDAEPQDDSAKHFVVTASYDTVEFDAGESAQAHPLKRDPEYDFGGIETSEPYFLDESKPTRKPFVNSAGDSFEQFYERDQAKSTITITRNEELWDIPTANAYYNTFNEEAQTIDGVNYAPGVLKMGLIAARKMSEVWFGLTVKFYSVVYNIKVDPNGWKDKPLDYGFNQIRQVTKSVGGVDTLVHEKLPILDAAGLKLSKPWPLDGQGRAKPSATDSPATLEFLPYGPLSWAPLQLN